MLGRDSSSRFEAETERTLVPCVDWQTLEMCRGTDTAVAASTTNGYGDVVIVLSVVVGTAQSEHCPSKIAYEWTGH